MKRRAVFLRQLNFLYLLLVFLLPYRIYGETKLCNYGDILYHL